jgi:hypothetical protein
MVDNLHKRLWAKESGQGLFLALIVLGLRVDGRRKTKSVRLALLLLARRLVLLLVLVLLLLLLLGLLLAVLPLVRLALVVVPRPISEILTTSTFAPVAATTALIVAVVAIWSTRRGWRWRSSVMIVGRRVGSSMRVVGIRLRVSTAHLRVLRVVIRRYRRAAPTTASVIVSAS